MKKNNNMSLHDVAIKMNEMMYGQINKKNILDAYSYMKFMYNIQYSYEEVKDYLFHHNPIQE